MIFIQSHVAKVLKSCQGGGAVCFQEGADSCLRVTLSRKGDCYTFCLLWRKITLLTSDPELDIFIFGKLFFFQKCQKYSIFPPNRTGLFWLVRFCNEAIRLVGYIFYQFMHVQYTCATKTSQIRLEYKNIYAKDWYFCPHREWQGSQLVLHRSSK